ncbi:KIR protein [Plasmodium coatneyi]|uniref:KIR protein n=1 Tax=Plasmodium coatneyi TaxID=208452 RepID=A0A1B1DUR1_9APIC|nr:KIR protein [Plasmodium coatneyi]ANQ06315.1 KIR protein [Plasmodium coatneyi]
MVTDTVDEELLKQLPSWTEYYEKFENEKGKKQKCKNDCAQGIKTVLGSDHSMNSYKDKIEKAMGYVYEMYEGHTDPLNNVPCTFLYNWVLNILYKSPMNAQIRGIVRFICTLINDAYKDQKCEVLCEQIDQNIFNHRKKVFELSYDYETATKVLQKGKTSCTGKWWDYLQGFHEACTAVEKDCEAEKGPEHNKYCQEFNSKYDLYCDTVKLLKLKCEPKPEPTVIVKEVEKACSPAPQKSDSSTIREADLTAAKTTASISSILGTLGLTVAPFLLYKVCNNSNNKKIRTKLLTYKPWSFWFGNHSNGEGRRSARKRRSVGNDLDTLTENDSILGSATESLMDNSTVRSSTATYTRPSTRQSTEGRTNNTRGHGMVGYQNM